MRNEISSSKEERKRPPVMPPRKNPREAMIIDRYKYRKAARSDGIEEGNTACGDWLGGGEQIKAKGVGKGG
jgi:hypothetical protein